MSVHERNERVLSSSEILSTGRTKTAQLFFFFYEKRDVNIDTFVKNPSIYRDFRDEKKGQKFLLLCQQTFNILN